MSKASVTSMQVASFPSTVFSFLISTAEHGPSLLLDCGPATVDKLVALNEDLLTIQDIFISHVHADHSSGLPLLFHSQCIAEIDRATRRDENKIIGLYSIRPLASQLREIADRLYPGVFEQLRKHSIHVESTDMIPQKRYELNNAIYLTAESACHSVPAFGARVEIPLVNKVVAFSGDTRPCEGMVSLALGADLLIHEAFSTSIHASKAHEIGHSTAADAAHIAQEAGVNTLLLCNYWYRNQGLEAGLLEEARAIFDGTVLVARDGQVIHLGSTTSTGNSDGAQIA